VDGAALDPSTPLADCGLWRGSAVGVDTDVADPSPGPDLVVVAGPLAPGRVRVAGTVLIGRGPACDLRLDHPSVALAHALVEISGGAPHLCPLTTTHTTTVDGGPLTRTVAVAPDAVLGIGAVDLQLVPPRPTTRPGCALPMSTTEEGNPNGDRWVNGAATMPVHRAPAAWSPRGPTPGPAPEAPPVEPPPRPPGALALLAPVAVGAVLAVAIHPTAGLFTAATPLLAVGAHLDANRRWRRDRRRSDVQHASDLADHERALATTTREEAADQRRRHPSPVDALARAREGRGLWPVRAPDPAIAHLAVGWLDDEARGPALVALADGDHLGIAGPARWAGAVGRGVLLSALTRCGPNDRGLVGATDGEWSFLRWLPHLDGSGLPLRIGSAATGTDSAIEIEIAELTSALTDRCRSVLAWSRDGAVLTTPGGDRSPVAIRPFVAEVAVAEDWARATARWTDPAAALPALPDRVRLPPLLTTCGEADRTGRRALRAPLGVGDDGVAGVDLVTDGPHALVAGTTGAGKSELLRTWVVALATLHPPTAVTFVLVDYKGGSAFDACARLPHVAGVVTDLDAGLGERLLTSLRAEVRDRETRLRAARVGDLRDLDEGPARLVVVVDEFATLAAELPDFLGALVDVARRGRSLGIHLVLATQRPAGAVNDDIRANMALRLCLRTLDPADSQDVIGGPHAAALPARIPGRAWLRSGTGLRLIQVADSGSRVGAGPVVGVRLVGSPWPAGDEAGPSDLEHLVQAAVAQWGDRPTPAPVWHPPLPEALTVPVDRRAGAVVLGRSDDPARRSQPPLTWDPDGGHLVVLGGRGRGRTTALRTAILALAASRPPDRVHVYVVGRPGSLDDLAALPHVGSVVALQDRPTINRLLWRLEARLDAADPVPPPRPLTLLALDGYEALTAAVDDLDGLRLLGAVDRLGRDGPRHGIVLALSSSRPSLQPPSLRATTGRLVVLGLDDPADYGLLGLRAPPRDALSPPGRGRTAEGHDLQIARLDLEVAQVAAGHGTVGAGRGPDPITPLPACVDLATLARHPDHATVGVRDRDLGPAIVDLRRDGPFVVTGPPRSGRTSALTLLAAQAPRLPSTRHRPGDDPDRLRRAVADWLARPSPHLFVVDDAERVDDPDGDLRALVTRRHPDAIVLLAVRADAWRNGYGSWSAGLRPAGRGLALRPDPVHDAEAWVCPLPAVGPAPPSGRGVLVVDGTAEVVQVARGDG